MKSIVKFKYKEILDSKNELIVIGLISIFLIIWIILYAIPGLLSSLFNTILGKLILLLLAILISYKNLKLGLLFFGILLIIYRLIYFSKTKEEFTWNKTSQEKFLKFKKPLILR